MARFFCDETDLLLAKRLELARPGDVVFPGHEELVSVPRSTLDPDWLPIVGAERLVVISRDKRIRSKPVEQALWVKHGIRGFVLTGRSSQSTEQGLELIENNWERIERTVEDRPTGPWMMALNSGGLREIHLSG